MKTHKKIRDQIKKIQRRGVACFFLLLKFFFFLFFFTNASLLKRLYSMHSHAHKTTDEFQNEQQKNASQTENIHK